MHPFKQPHCMSMNDLKCVKELKVCDDGILNCEWVPQVNPQASMSASLAQTPFCKHRGYDPQSPLCAHIILSGSVQEVLNALCL